MWAGAGVHRLQAPTCPLSCPYTICSDLKNGFIFVLHPFLLFSVPSHSELKIRRGPSTIFIVVSANYTFSSFSVLGGKATPLWNSELFQQQALHESQCLGFIGPSLVTVGVQHHSGLCKKIFESHPNDFLETLPCLNFPVGRN
jgi:hypothetical protein